MENLVVILAGSESDKWWTDKLEEACKDQGIATKVHFDSAHKKPREVLACVESYADQKVIFFTVAGRSNALSGVVAGSTTKPVFAIPPFQDKMDFMVNINSTLQMPSKTPVLTILEPVNAAMAAKSIFDL